MAAILKNMYAFMNVQQALGIHTRRQEPGWKKTRHTLEKQTNKRKHPALPRSLRIIVCVPKRRGNETNTRQSTQSDSHTDHDLP